MKIKTLTWSAPAGTDMHMSDDTIPQMLYIIRKIDVDKYKLNFYHGYVTHKDQHPIYEHSDVNNIKQFAQLHFEGYILSSYCEQ